MIPIFKLDYEVPEGMVKNLGALYTFDDFVHYYEQLPTTSSSDIVYIKQVFLHNTYPELFKPRKRWL